MKALYPFVGGTASQHKFNLKDPRDLDAAYRLVFAGGWTHSSTGAQPNGTTGYADTKLIPVNVLTPSSGHLSIYSRTNIAENGYDIGVTSGSNYDNMIASRYGNNKFLSNYGAMTYPTVDNTDSRGFFITNRNSATNTTGYKNGINVINASQTGGVAGFNVFIGALKNDILGITNFSSKEQAFASIGDGLTDTEAANFYTAVQTFQTTLGRQVGVPIVADSDVQAFLNAAVITDSTQASAINTLVTDLKTANIWTKMKALYPFVGGTASSHKFNLKDPRDLDAAYRLVFAGGWTHSSTGAKPSGTNGWADTKLIPSSTQNVDSNGIGVYAGTLNNAVGTEPVYIGVFNSVTQSSSLGSNSTNNNIQGRLNGSPVISSTIVPTGLLSFQKTTSTLSTLYKNSTNVGSGNSGGTLPTNSFMLGVVRGGDTNPYGPSYVNSEFRLSYVSDGLDSTDMTNLYTAVQKYQTTLGRQV